MLKRVRCRCCNKLVSPTEFQYKKTGGINNASCIECRTEKQRHLTKLKKIHSYDSEQCCEICDRPQKELKKRIHSPHKKKHKVLVLDHDHTNGLFRGWLCAKCNMALGNFEDDAWRAFRAYQYLSYNCSLALENKQYNETNQYRRTR